MFNEIAKGYDRNAKIISFGIESLWRKKFIKLLKKHIKSPVLYLDVASATGDMIKELNFEKNIALEPSKEMNELAKNKLKNINVDFIEDTAESFKLDEKVDLVTIFMGVRNFEDIEEGLKNIDLYLKNGGVLAITELTTPKNFNPIYHISNFYMSYIVPVLGGLLSGNFKAYSYFPKSIKKISDDDIIKQLQNYEIIEHKRLFPPIASIIIARKNG
jgi:demethylmenaquinone methyltransferase/2-methoxy-6-polyprenyl-1,4-benzoquinol methylase